MGSTLKLTTPLFCSTPHQMSLSLLQRIWKVLFLCGLFFLFIFSILLNAQFAQDLSYSPAAYTVINISHTLFLLIPPIFFIMIVRQYSVKKSWIVNTMYIIAAVILVFFAFGLGGKLSVDGCGCSSRDISSTSPVYLYYNYIALSSWLMVFVIFALYKSIYYLKNIFFTILSVVLALVVIYFCFGLMYHYSDLIERLTH
jgi:hypothetical protein